MPKMNFGLDLTDTDAAEGFSDYDGPLPPNGSYMGKLKLCQVVPMKKDPTKKRISILVEITDKDYKGYPAWGGVNLTDQGKGFVAQFLRALTDGSDAEFDQIRKAFSSSATVVDEKKTNIIKIGKWKVESPDGSLPIRVTLKQEPYNGKVNAKVQTFLLRDGTGSVTSDDGDVVEESDVVDAEDGVVVDDEDTDETEVEDEDTETEVVDETIFDADAEETVDA